MKKETAFEHTVPAVDKAVLILETLINGDTGMSHAALASACGITVSTCYRILRSLVLAGWLEKRQDGTYRPAAGLLPLAVRVCTLSGGNFDHAQQILESLAAETLLACKLSVRKNDCQLVIARAESPGPFSVSGRTGATFPLTEGSVGAALLADSTPDEWQTLLSGCSDDIPEKQDPAILERGIESVRSRGYSLNTTDNRWRIGALSVPLRDASGKIVAALTLLGMADDFSKKRLPSLLKALDAAKKKFSK